MVKTVFIIFFTLLINSLSAQQWVIYNTQNSEIPFNTPRSVAIEIDRNGNNVKWIGVGGVTKLVNNQWTLYNDSNSGMPSQGAWCIAIKDSIKWIGTFGGGLVRFDNINWQVWNSTNSAIPLTYIFSIATDKFDNIIFGAPILFVKFNYLQNIWQIYPNHFHSSIETIVYEDTTKSYWLGTENHGMFKLYENQNDTNITNYNASNSGIGSNRILEIDIDAQANKWIATQLGGGLRKFNSIDSTWAGFFPGAFFTCLLVDDSAGVKWLGTPGGGLWKFIDDSVWVNYRPENSPFPSFSAVDIAKDSLNNIWICTVDGLVVHNPNGVVGIESNNAITVPVDFKLFQNYPNPFNPTTTIEFELVKPTNVKLKIYNSTGNLINIITDRKFTNGKHKVIFDGTGLSSGVYFYQLETTNYNEARKMILLK